MNNKVDPAVRTHFRDWFKAWLRVNDFYTKRSDHYLIREFAKYCLERQEQLQRDLKDPSIYCLIDEASLGRYLRDEDPVLPTPERCRHLAYVMDKAPVDVFAEAGYLEVSDFFRRDEPQGDITTLSLMSHFPASLLAQYDALPVQHRDHQETSNGQTRKGRKTDKVLTGA